MKQSAAAWPKTKVDKKFACQLFNLPRAPFLCHCQRTAAVARSDLARRFGALFHVAMVNATQCLQNSAVSLLQVHTHWS